MGSSNSRRMDDSDSRSRSDVEDSDHDSSDLAAILQYLIRSGQVHIISSDRDDDSEDEFVAAASPPRIDARPNTKVLDRNEISQATKIACGLIHSSGPNRPTSVASMINAREKGWYGVNGFSRSERCKITNCYIPNTLDIIASYPNKAFCGSYTADNGNYFLSACQDRKLRLYNSENFQLLKTIQARDVGWSILDVAFSPDETMIVYSSWSECLHLCRTFADCPDENQEALLLCPDQRRFCIFSLQFSTGGNEILGGANDGFIYVYDIETKQRALRIKGHEDDVNTVAYADKSSYIVYSGGDDGLCKVWDRRTLSEANPKPCGVLAGHRDGVTYIDSRGDSRHFISNSKDQSIKLWDIRLFSNATAQETTRQAVLEQNWDYRWQKVPRKLSNVRKNLPGDTSVMTYRGHSVLQTLVKCHFSPEYTTGQRYIYTGCAAGRIVIYDLLTGKVVKFLEGHRACVRDVSWHPKKHELISTSWDGSLGRWTYSGKTKEDSESEADAVSLTPDEIEAKTLRRSQRIAERQLLSQGTLNGPTSSAISSRNRMNFRKK